MRRSASKRVGGMARWAALAALGLSLAFGTTAQAAPQYTLDCTSCHTLPPTDTHNRKKDPYTGGIPGNHQQHATTDVNSCVVCHGQQVTGYTTSHRQKAIALSDSLTYSRKQNGFLNQTSVPPTPVGNCSTAACHSDGKGNMRSTPEWGSAPLDPALQSSCSTCHDVAPGDGNHPSAVAGNPGYKHGLYFGTGVDSCQNCHNNHFGEAKPFLHATSAGKRGIDVHFASGGSFNGTQCSNVYCHSNGKGSYATPTWGGTLDCSGCHGNATSDTLSGKHSKHVNNASFLGDNYGCIECHAATVSDNSTIVDRAKHVNGGVDFAGPRVGTPSNGTCANTYCHSDGKGNSISVSWTQTDAVTCKSCHGASTAPGSFTSLAGEPNYANGGVGATANTHQTHVKVGATDCQNCHSATTATGTSILSGGKHTDGSIEVVAGNGKSFDFSSKTCSNISCHSGNGIIANVQPATWGASLGCSGCHGDSSTLSTNQHQKHVTSMGYGCATCHSATAATNSSLVAGGPHANGSIDVVGSSVTFNYTDLTCATACHGSATPKWTDAATGACGTCHNALSNTTNGLIASNAHTTHFGASYGPKFDGTTANSCAVCHVYTGDTTTTHDNGVVNLNTGFAKSGTCGTCHNQSVDWTSTARLACESCHTGSLSVINGITAPDKSLSATSGHGAAGKQCVDCHDNTSAHIGVSGGTQRLVTALQGGNSNECLNCHSDASKVTNADKQITDVHYSFANACAVCHDPHGTTNSNMVLANFSTAAGKNVGVSYSGTTSFITADGKGICQVCHTQTTYMRRGEPITASSHQQVGANCLDCHKHNPGAGQIAFSPSGTCNACHGYPPVPRSLNWVAGVTFAKQGQYSAARFEDYSGGGGAHVALAHLDPNITPDMGFAPCLKCHNDGAASHLKALPLKSHIENVTVKVDPQYRFSGDVPFMGYTGAQLVSGANKTGSCFNVSCHFRPSPQWSTEK